MEFTTSDYVCADYCQKDDDAYEWCHYVWYSYFSFLSYRISSQYPSLNRFLPYSFHSKNLVYLKFIYSENATKFCEIFTLLLSYVLPVKSKVKILQNLVAFSEYMNFTRVETRQPVTTLMMQALPILKFTIIKKLGLQRKI